MAKDSNRGRLRRVSDDEITSVFTEADDPILTRNEVAEELPIKPRQTLDRLRTLEEKGILGSKEVAGADVWWHQQFEAARVWHTNDDDASEVVRSKTEIIGVPYVDMVDVPGKGEDLYYRRLSLNAVFRQLFRETKVEPSELRKLARVSTPLTTYKSEEGLWNNCINPALNQSIFFTVRKDSQNWILSELGKWVADTFNAKAIWEDWEPVASQLESRISGKTSLGIQSFLDEHHDVEPIRVGESESDAAYILRVGDFHYGLEFEYAESTWREGEFEINVAMEFSGDSEVMDKLNDNSENLADQFEQDIILNENGDRITVSLPMSATLKPNSPSMGLSDKSPKIPPVENPQITVNSVRRFDNSFRDILFSQ